jgi:protein SCO1/2
MMVKFNFRILIITLILLACNSDSKNQIGVKYLPFYKNASFTPYWFEPGSDSLKEFHRVLDFELINQHGDTITQDSLAGKIFVVDFFFTTCPGICPRMTKNMALLQEKFEGNPDIALLSHSVTPQRDSVTQLAKYARAKGITWKNWHLLTGDKKQIYNLGRKAYFIEENQGVDKSEEDFIHTENFVLIDKNRHIRGIYNGLNKTSIQDLINDIVALKAE